jgi:predicted TPR repeat methyltransferase
VVARRVDVSRLYGARDLDELREEYERIASIYDHDLAGPTDYRSPPETAAVCSELLAHGAQILDVGAGTGLLGAELAAAGFSRLDALDLSAAMLAEAQRKGIYGDLVVARLGERLPVASDAYDGVVACGVMTTGHAPASCLDELVRITRPGGHVVFTLRSDRTPAGFDEKIADLRDAGRWELVERGEEFQAMPTSEPEVLVRVWTFRVLSHSA